MTDKQMPGDAELLAAFSSGESVIDGLHEVVTLVARALQPRPTAQEWQQIITHARAEYEYIRDAQSAISHIEEHVALLRGDQSAARSRLSIRDTKRDN